MILAFVSLSTKGHSTCEGDEVDLDMGPSMDDLPPTPASDRYRLRTAYARIPVKDASYVHEEPRLRLHFVFVSSRRRCATTTTISLSKLCIEHGWMPQSSDAAAFFRSCRTSSPYAEFLHVSKITVSRLYVQHSSRCRHPQAHTIPLHLYCLSRSLQPPLLGTPLWHTPTPRP